MLNKKQRLEEFFHRLGDAAAANSHDEAYMLIVNLLDQVENELSGVPYGNPSGIDDGRMYAPLTDSRRAIPGRADLVRYRSRLHNTFVATNGAIKVVTVDGVLVFEKYGADGKGVGGI